MFSLLFMKCLRIPGITHMFNYLYNLLFKLPKTIKPLFIKYSYIVKMKHESQNKTIVSHYA